MIDSSRAQMLLPVIDKAVDDALSVNRYLADVRIMIWRNRLDKAANILAAEGFESESIDCREVAQKLFRLNNVVDVATFAAGNLHRLAMSIAKQKDAPRQGDR